MIDFLFFKSPSLLIRKDNSFAQKAKELLFNLFYMYLLLFVATIVLKLVDYYVQNQFNFSFYETIFNKQKMKLSNSSIFRILFIVPLLEELIFRLPLSLKKMHMPFISLLFVIFLIHKPSDVYNFRLLIKLILIILLLGSLIYKFFDQQILVIISTKFYPYYFYTFCISFGLMHLLNFYRSVPVSLIVIAPLFVVPQIITGYFISYIRLRNGFFWGLVFHCICNMLAVYLFDS
ncbi:hypothetical protein [Flavobacterium sp. ASV13]|uniref:hypothetical protein n=1 Tax=Flavobacterium sp. ASV13 TaxID=1506583 RepID=UPI0005520061|nr:hypothetical protein [Flavobacterium sp. ASV13]